MTHYIALCADDWLALPSDRRNYMPRFLGRFVVGAGALLIAATAQAQGPSNAPARPWKIGGALGATIPLGNFSDGADLGWHLGGLFE